MVNMHDGRCLQPERLFGERERLAATRACQRLVVAPREPPVTVDAVIVVAIHAERLSRAARSRVLAELADVEARGGTVGVSAGFNEQNILSNGFLKEFRDGVAKVLAAERIMALYRTDRAQLEQLDEPVAPAKDGPDLRQVTLRCVDSVRCLDRCRRSGR